MKNFTRLAALSGAFLALSSVQAEAAPVPQASTTASSDAVTVSQALPDKAAQAHFAAARVQVQGRIGKQYTPFNEQTLSFSIAASQRPQSVQLEVVAPTADGKARESEALEQLSSSGIKQLEQAIPGSTVALTRDGKVLVTIEPSNRDVYITVRPMMLGTDGMGMGLNLKANVSPDESGGGNAGSSEKRCLRL